MKLQVKNAPYSQIVLVAALLVATNTFAVAASGTWVLTGTVQTARDGHIATLLPNGNVIVSGGEKNDQVVASTEVYNPATGFWTTSGNLNVARSNASVVLLPSGAVLVAGGCVANCLGATTDSAELYDAVNGTWSSTGGMATARAYFGMALLANGKVLVAGGCTGLNAHGCSGVTGKTEIYDPAAGTWVATGPMNTARGAFTLTLLQNGKVLAAGGLNRTGDAIRSSELYDPASGKWSLTGKLKVARDEHTAVLLPNGNVLTTGGENSAGFSTPETELYNPSTGKWTPTGNLNAGRLEHTATLLTNGQVLIAGGTRVTRIGSQVLASAEIYDPATGGWTKTGRMNNSRTGHTATLLNSGMVLAASGSGGNKDRRSAELYTPEVPPPNGNIYVVDTDNSRVQVFDGNGVYQFQFAHSFDLPTDITLDALNNAFVKDGNLHCHVDKFDSTGTFLLTFGACSGGGIGPGIFDNTGSVVSDANGNVWVTSPDFYYMQKYDGTGHFQSIVCMAEVGVPNCPQVTPFLVQPQGIEIDSGGNIYVSNAYPFANGFNVVKFDSSGNYLASFGSAGSGNGQFNDPEGLGFDSSGNIYVADARNNRVQKFDKNGNYLSQFGTLGSGNGQFRAPLAIAFDTSGNIYVTDDGNNRVQKFDANGNYLSQFGSPGNGNGQFNTPYGIAISK